MTNTKPVLLTSEEMAEHLRISVRTLRSWARQGAIPPDAYIKVGNTYRYDREKTVTGLQPGFRQVDDVDPIQLTFDFDEDIQENHP